MQINIPEDLGIDEGVIMSGLCSTPDAQAEFDRNQAGHPPHDER